MLKQFGNDLSDLCVKTRSSAGYHFLHPQLLQLVARHRLEHQAVDVVLHIDQYFFRFEHDLPRLLRVLHFLRNEARRVAFSLHLKFPVEPVVQRTTPAKLITILATVVHEHHHAVQPAREAALEHVEQHRDVLALVFVSAAEVPVQCVDDHEPQRFGERLGHVVDHGGAELRVSDVARPTADVERRVGQVEIVLNAPGRSASSDAAHALTSDVEHRTGLHGVTVPLRAGGNREPKVDSQETLISGAVAPEHADPLALDVVVD